MSKDHDHDWQHDEPDVAVAPAGPELKQPPKYRVLMINDDYTPMDFVIEVLVTLFHMDYDKAAKTMMQVHTEGQAQCGVFTYEIAEAKVEQANSYAQQHGHPLQCTMEEE